MDGGDGATQDFGFSVYINPNNEDDKSCGEMRREIPASLLEGVLQDMNPIGPWRVSKTHCGLLAAFVFEDDALTLLNLPLGDLLRGLVHVARLSKDTKYKQSLFLKDIPWAIPMQEIRLTLQYQGIYPVSMDRLRQNVRIEINDPVQYEHLLRHGLDFHGVARFLAVPDKWRNNVVSRPNLIMERAQQDSVVQCYKCQGFWHIAANCQEATRCVRCGGQHPVENCQRPRDQPTCCHCLGPHHAAFRLCPVRLQMSSAPFLASPFIVHS